MPRGKTKKSHSNVSKKSLEDSEEEIDMDDTDYLSQFTNFFFYPFTMMGSLLDYEEDTDEEESTEEPIQKKKSQKKKGRPRTKRHYKN